MTYSSAPALIASTVASERRPITVLLAIAWIVGESWAMGRWANRWHLRWLRWRGYQLTATELPPDQWPGQPSVAAAQGLLRTDALSWALARPVWVTPAWSWQAILGMGLPLFIVTMASQAVPGVSAIRVFGYRTPVSPLMSWSGVTTVLLAPFGGYAFNLAAITATIVLQPHAHPDPHKRYTAALVAGLFYLVMALLGGAVAGVLTAFPTALIMGVAGLALLGTIANGLAASLLEARYREAAVITFLVTLSGVTLMGVGSAFWGLVAGTLTLFVEHFRARPSTTDRTPS